MHARVVDAAVGRKDGGPFLCSQREGRFERAPTTRVASGGSVAAAPCRCASAAHLAAVPRAPGAECAGVGVVVALDQAAVRVVLEEEEGRAGSPWSSPPGAECFREFRECVNFA